MPDAPLTLAPRTAADAVERWMRSDDPHTQYPGDALRILVDRTRATALTPEGGDLAAVLDRLLVVANDLIRDTTDPGTEALAAVWCAQQALGRTPASEGGDRVGETECGTCGETVDVYMAPVTEAHEWGPDDGPGSENPPTLCPGSHVDHGDVARLNALRLAPALSVATPPQVDGHPDFLCPVTGCDAPEGKAWHAAPASPDGHDIPAFVVMSERKTELAYKGVHTREAAESLAGGFDDVEVRGAEDVIRELCEQVQRHDRGDGLSALADDIDSAAEDVADGKGADALGPLGSIAADLRAHRCARTASEVAPQESGEPYLHTLRCVKDACTEDCPRRHESERATADRTVSDDILVDLARAVAQAHDALPGNQTEVRETLEKVGTDLTGLIFRIDYTSHSGARRWVTVEADPMTGESLETEQWRHLATAAEFALRPVLVTGAEAATLPVESIVVVCDEDGTPFPESMRFPASTVGYQDGETDRIETWSHARVLYRAPEPDPLASLAVDDLATTVAQLDALPIGALVRTKVGMVAERSGLAWRFVGAAGEFPSSGLTLPASVVDLPDAVGSS